jgi:hypothetical protein
VTVDNSWHSEKQRFPIAWIDDGIHMLHAPTGMESKTTISDFLRGVAHNDVAGASQIPNQSAWVKRHQKTVANLQEPVLPVKRNHQPRDIGNYRTPHRPNRPLQAKRSQ